jgi:hypothetical protein
MSQDSVTLNPGTGGKSVAADLISGNDYQQVKIVDGTLGSTTPLKIAAGGQALVLQPDVTWSGTVVDASTPLVQSGLNNYNTLTSFISGTWVGNVIIAGSIDGTNYVDLQTFNMSNYGTTNSVLSTGYNKTSISGFSYVKFYFNTYTSGSVSVGCSATNAQASPLDGFPAWTDPNNDFATWVSLHGATVSTSLDQIGGSFVQPGNGPSYQAVRVTLANDSTGQVALTTSSATIGALVANQSVNLTQVNGTTLAAGNGTNASAMLVTIASDSTGQVKLAPGTAAIGSLTTGSAVIGSLTANQSVNNTQVNGVTIATGNGVTGTGVQRVTLSSDSTGQVTLATGANTIGALTANQTVNLNQLAGTATATGNGVTSAGTLRVSLSSDSTGQVKLAAGANAIGSVTVTGTPSVSISGTATVSGTVTASNTAGDTASGSTDAGNPVKIGSKALNAVPTSVTTGQRTAVLVDTMGRVIIAPQLRQGVLFTSTTITSSTTATTIIAAAASTYNDLTQLTITNGSTTATVVTISDGTNTLGLYNIPAGGGIVLPFPTPVSQTTANTAWTATCGTSVASIYVSAVYQTSK